MDDRKQTLKRRGLLGGAATLGVLATAAATLPSQDGSPAPDVAAKPTGADTTAGGYQLTAHVQHYYKTARI